MRLRFVGTECDPDIEMASASLVRAAVRGLLGHARGYVDVAALLLEGEGGGPLVPAIAVWAVADAGPEQVGVLPNRSVVVVAKRLWGRRVHAAYQRAVKCL